MIRIIMLLMSFIILSFTGVDTGAAIELPQTGQVMCYDVYNNPVNDCLNTGQDGDTKTGAQWPDPRFTPVYCGDAGPCADQGADCDANASNDMVRDNLTGLVWARSGNLSPASQTWDNAIDFANGLTLCGHDDWRLPNINELESLVSAGEPDVSAWLTTQGFLEVESPSRIDYWSSTTSKGNTALIYAVRLVGAGEIQGLSKALNYLKILPVRGETTSPAQVWRTGQTLSYRTGDDGNLKTGAPWPSPRFEVHGDTVADRLTNLMWTKNAASQGPPVCNPEGYKTWNDALDFIKCLNQNDYLGGGWRLPNRKELRSLVDYGQDNPALPQGNPFTFANLNYWSSTTVANLPERAWYVPMSGGTVMSLAKNENFWSFVWPVRTYIVLGIVSPAVGSIIAAGSDYEITWTAPSGADTFNLSYSTNNGERWLPVQTALGNTHGISGEFVSTSSFTGTTATWRVPLLKKNNNKCLVKITAYDKSGKKMASDKSDQPFTIEVLTITNPASNSACASGVPCPVSWNKAPGVDAQTGKLYSSFDGGVNWKLIDRQLTGADTGFAWTPGVKKTKKNCKVKLVYKDTSGKTVGTAISGKFSITVP